MRVQHRIIKLRVTRQLGPHRIGYRLGIARSTVGRVLARYNMLKLACIDQATGLPVRKRPRCATSTAHRGSCGLTPAQRVHNVAGKYI